MIQPRKDFLRLPALLLFMGCLIWIGFDLFQTQMARKEIARGINYSLALQKNGYTFAALRRATEVRQQWFNLQKTPANFYLEKVQPFSIDLDEALALLHLEMAREFSKRQSPQQAEKHFSLALLYDHELEGVPGALMMECFFTKNFELGWVSSRLVKDGAEKAPSTALINFFERNYRGPRYGE